MNISFTTANLIVSVGSEFLEEILHGHVRSAPLKAMDNGEKVSRGK